MCTNPWVMVQPNRCSALNVISSSTPSATRSAPRLSASATVDRTMATDRGVLGQSRHEDSVEFQLVDRDILQACQRRPAGAVVVQRDANAKVLQLGYGIAGSHRVDEGAFGDLDDERVGGQTVGSQQPLDRADKVKVKQIRRREVHRDGRERCPARAKTGSVRGRRLSVRLAILRISPARSAAGRNSSGSSTHGWDGASAAVPRHYGRCRLSR